MSCFFIEPMAQAIDDADYLYLTACEETHLQSDFTLDSCLLRLGGVTCLRFRDHNWRSESRLGIHGRELHVTGTADCGAKVRATHLAMTARLSPSTFSITK